MWQKKIATELLRLAKEKLVLTEFTWQAKDFTKFIVLTEFFWLTQETFLEEVFTEQGWLVKEFLNLWFNAYFF